MSHTSSPIFVVSKETKIIILKISPAMTDSVIFSSRVLTTLNSLPVEQRSTMAAALTSEFLLGLDVTRDLHGEECLVYAIIRQYVRQDMRRASAAATA